jgi:starch synthase
MKILFVVSEVEDLAKTGGLADVAKSLPMALRALGHDVRIVKPYYRQLAEKFNLENLTEPQKLVSGDKEYRFNIKRLELESVPVYCIDYPDYFHRNGLYSDGYEAFGDNAERFAFFSAAALHAAKAVNFQPDVIHCNDWHTALCPFFVKQEESEFFARSRTLFTIHNGAYQGIHKFADIPFVRPYGELASQIDSQGNLNYLRMGLRYADKINAVSPNYARELLTPLGSHNLYQDFQLRANDVSGILNGCDYQQWDPSTDKFLPKNYNSESLKGKAACKAALQDEVGLPVNDKVPLVGMLCRLTEQKGFGYLLPVLSQLLQHNVQLLVIGTGDPVISDVLEFNASQHPDKLVFRNDFSTRIAHLLEAGCDFFLMPSLFEPCGLNQMYSLAYGTIPIVRAVGGLRDTVLDLQMLPDQATGFMFEAPDSSALLNCVRRALLFYHEYPQEFVAMQKRAMRHRFTWYDAALNYQALYQHCLPMD